MKQKYQKGDLVRIKKELPTGMSHFVNDEDAVVMGSYNDQYGGGNVSSYTLFIKGRGEVSWYYENNFDLIEKNRIDLKEEWERELAEDRKKESDLDLIFSKPDEINAINVVALAKEMGISEAELWGPMGEGFAFHMNSIRILGLCDKYLKANDKEGFLKFTEEFKKMCKNNRKVVR